MLQESVDYPEGYFPVGAGTPLFEQLMVIVRAYSSYRRLLLTSIFKYLYQQDIEVDNFNGLQLPEWDLGIDLNTNESMDIWIDNLTPYLDDLINVINKDILDENSFVGQGIGTESGSRLELYLWNENPNDNGHTIPHLTELWKLINYNSI